MILTRICEHLEDILQKHPFRFRKGHDTTDHSHRIVKIISFQSSSKHWIKFWTRDVYLKYNICSYLLFSYYYDLAAFDLNFEFYLHGRSSYLKTRPLQLTQTIHICSLFMINRETETKLLSPSDTCQRTVKQMTNQGCKDKSMTKNLQSNERRYLGIYLDRCFTWRINIWTKKTSETQTLHHADID